MILTKVQTTPKQRTEFRLLVAIRFACLMAKSQGISQPIDCPRVQHRASKLAKYLAYNHPSQAFQQQYMHHAGELGQLFSLRYTEPKQGITGVINVWSHQTNLHQLTA
ncbi:hypothetical protein L2755_04600 [Shewanella abyssi]|uniref:hypothetical protein n=1 Tax=Shewanella abyssi TaxID=311789 RepID=UPI00200FEA2B|nr:hypothetical protein [Shewanella abyssi]MCL1048909.1 hypothetical protein [Shewanella abyssi]